MRTRPSKRARMANREIDIHEAFGDLTAAREQFLRLRDHHFVPPSRYDLPPVDIDGALLHRMVFDEMSALLTEAGLRPLYKPIGINLNVSAPMPTLTTMDLL